MLTMDQDKKELTRRLIIFGVPVVLLIVVLLLAFLFFGSSSDYTITHIDHGTASQYITPFKENYLYYDGTVLYCYGTDNSLKWSHTLGSGARFDAGDVCVAAWTGTKLVIIDSRGTVTYDSQLTASVQFARCGSRYVAVVLGDNISPTLYIKDLQGNTIDSESAAYEDMMILDCGFFSDGEYLWTTALDVYGTVPNIILNTYRPGQMNTGQVSLGENLVYKILWAENKLNIISTRSLKRYDYRGTEDSSASQLVYGWKLIASDPSGTLQMLFARANQADDMTGLTNLRYLSGSTDKLYTLPSACVGAVIRNNRIYAFAANTIYRTDISSQRFSAIDISLPGNAAVTAYLCTLSNGTILLASGNDIYAVKLP